MQNCDLSFESLPFTLSIIEMLRRMYLTFSECKGSFYINLSSVNETTESDIELTVDYHYLFISFNKFC